MAEGTPKTLGQFEITGELGRGGMAVVFKGYQPSLDRHVAIKTLPADRTGNREMVSRFKREVSTMVALNHTNIVQIIDSGEEQGLHYYAMEFVDGPDLKGLMKEGLTIDQAFDIAGQICDGLAYAHKKGMIHRDVKPANVLWESSTGLAKIADFGIAKDVSMVTLTGTDVGMGTMNYMAPEQKQQARDVDHRADIYAVGVVIYEMFTGGKLPMGRFKMPSELTPGLPKALDDVVAKCLETLPEDRYDSLEQVRVDLEAARTSVGTSGSQRLLSIRDAAEKTLTAVAGEGQGGVVLGLCLLVSLMLIAGASGAYYMFVVRAGGEVAGGDPSPSASPTAGGAPSPSQSEQPSPSETAAPSPSTSPAASPSETPAPSPSKTPAPSPSKTPAPSPSKTPAPSPSQTPAPSETPAPSPSRTPPPSPTPSRPPAVNLTEEQRALIASAETECLEVERLISRWGAFRAVERADALQPIPKQVAALRAQGDTASTVALKHLLDRLRDEARRDLVDELINPRLLDAEQLLGFSEDDYARILGAKQDVERRAAPAERIARYGRLLDELVQAEIEAYKLQAELAFALAVQRGAPAEWTDLAEELKQIAQAPGRDLLALESKTQDAVRRVRLVGVPGDIAGLDMAAEVRVEEQEFGVVALTSICEGDGGGVAAIGRSGDGGAYLLLLKIEGDALKIDARQRVSDGAYWVAPAGRKGGVSSYWVGENSPGAGLVLRYGFRWKGSVEMLGELEQLQVEVDPRREYLLDLATGVDGTLHALTNERVFVYFGPDDARRLVGEVSLEGEFVDGLPLPRRLAPLADGRLVVTGDARSKDQAWRSSVTGGMWSTKSQVAWEFTPKLFDYRARRRGQRVRAAVSSDPCALVGLGERLLGASYQAGQAGVFLQYASAVARGDVIANTGPAISLASDAAFARGTLFVLDQPVPDARHERKRLRAYTARQ